MNFDEFCDKLLGKKKKFEDLTEEEYYAQFERIDPDRPGFSERERETMRWLKRCPPPYDIVKKHFTGEL